MYPRFENRGIIAPPHPLFFLNNEEGYIVIVRFKRMREAERRFWQARAELWKNIRNMFGW